MNKTYRICKVTANDNCTREFLSNFRVIVEEVGVNVGGHETVEYATPLKTLDDLWDIIGVDCFYIRD